MTADRPTWSIMIPAYNCSHYLPETIQSVLQQDMGEDVMQIEVVDDCSTDTNIEELVNVIGKGRVLFYRQKSNVGSLRNFETCINRSKGRYIHLLHGDDKVEFGFYKEIEILFDKYPDAGAAFTNFNYIDQNGGKLKILNEFILDVPGIIPDFLTKIAEKQLLQTPAIVVKRSTYEVLGGFYAAHFGEDWEMWTRIASRYPVAYSPKCLALYRVAHGIGISHESFCTGQNIADIKKIINIIQFHLPENKRRMLKKAALSNYAKYCTRVANSLLLHNKQAALVQIKGAWNMHKNPNTTFKICRFYIMYAIRYKQIAQFIKNKIKVLQQKYQPDYK